MQVKSIAAIILTFIKLPFVIKIFVLPILEWPLETGFTVDISDKNRAEQEVKHICWA